MALTHASGSFEYLRMVAEYIRRNEASLRYGEYCTAYCDYLECVFTRQPYDVAGGAVEALYEVRSGHIAGDIAIRS